MIDRGAVHNGTYGAVHDCAYGTVHDGAYFAVHDCAHGKVQDGAYGAAHRSERARIAAGQREDNVLRKVRFRTARYLSRGQKLSGNSALAAYIW